MIRMAFGRRAQRRPLPTALLLGLMLLVAAHLVGALHGPGFLDPHHSVAGTHVRVPTAKVQVASATDHDHGQGQGHRHGDASEDSLQHAVDRVRDSADLPVRVPHLAEPALDRPDTHPWLGRAGPTAGDSAPDGGRSACVRHCLWRQ
ncbi:hypothetical protein AB5J52_25705 [Streptomyces sp. R39]|uniref:Secreted protein n=1 Tax=Streptomyces sp. R39 TaxID=3238631 RepID=A0AB39QPF9_9ACTN